MEEFATLLRQFQNTQNDLYIAGDFNVDLLKFKERQIFGEFVETLFTNSIYPLITSPTRITSHSATLIDNFLSKFSPSFTSLLSGILTHWFSDQQTYFITINDVRGRSKIK
jgi:hypothetical protein